MWDFLTHLPPALSFTIIALALSATVLVLLRGRFKAKIGDKVIDVGDGLREVNQPIALPPPTQHATIIPATYSTVTQKRSCGDCVLLLFGEREKLELNIQRERNRILKSQMNFAEQKLIEIQNILLNAIANTIHASVEAKTSTVDEAVQYKMSYGLLKESLVTVKDEIRRSFKEGEFYEMNGTEFSVFVKERASIVIFMMTTYVRNIYPDRGGVLEVSEVIATIENKAPHIGTIINDVYTHARDTKQDIDHRINNLKIQFGLWVDNFSK